MNDANIKSLLASQRIIAVVGFSLKSERPSHYVSLYMHRAGYTVLPINPAHGGQPSGIPGVPVYASIGDAMAATRLTPGIVNIFRRSEEVGPVVSDAIQAGAAAVWMQQGIYNPDEAVRAEAAGLQVIMDKCIKLEHMRLLGGV